MASRAEQRRATRAALADAALDLFDADGYAAVTMEDIARRAGVSRPTAFRHFGSKAETVVAVQDEWIRLFQQAVESRLPGETAAHVLRRASHAIAAHITTDRRRVVRAARLTLRHPALLVPAAVQDILWQSLVAGLVRDETDDLVAAVTAGAYMGMFRAVVAAWVASDGEADIHAQVDAGFALLENGLLTPV
jgi:AcrR family transcriptional regulator